MPDIIIPPETIPAGTLVTASSYLIDRIQPACEIIALPATESRSGTLTCNVKELTASRAGIGGSTGVRSILNRASRSAKISAPSDKWIIDLRDHAPANWAHFLNNHLPLLFGLADICDLDPSTALAILPADIPAYICAAADLFGIQFLTTNDPVQGRGVDFSVNPWTAIRAMRADWAKLSAPKNAIQKIRLDPSQSQLPPKVFLSRKDTRILSNEPEIETLLTGRGFQKIYPETLSPADQFRLFQQADEIVAVHGAALAPLLYCTPEHRPMRLIEILPCGHMTNVFRAMAGQIGLNWIGVRGRIKPEYVKPAYNFDTGFMDFSLDKFEVDPESLRIAFDLTDR